MNSSVIKEFLVGLGFQVDEAGAKKFESGIKAATIKVAALGAAATAAAGAVGAFVGAVANRLDAVSDASLRIGVTAEELMRLQYAAKLSDSSAEAATSSLENLGRIAGEAALGIGRGAKVFEDLGLSATDANGALKPTTQILGEVGDKIRGLQRGEQVAILQRLGIDPTMLQTIINGLDELGSEFDEIYAAAGVNLNDAAQASSDFNDALERMKMTFEGATTAIAVRLMPRIAEAFETLRRIMLDNMPRIIAVVTPILDTILRIGSGFLQIAARIAQGAGMILGFLAKLNEATDGWAGYILAAWAAWKYLNLGFLATPIGMLLSLIAVVALLIDDFLTFREGGDSLIDWGSSFGTLMKVVTGILTGLLAAIMLVKGAMAAKAIVLGGLKIAMAAFNLVMMANPIGLVIAAIVALIAIGYLLITNWDTVKEWFIGLWDWFANTFPQISGFITAAFEVAAAVIIAVFEGVKAWFTTLYDWWAAIFSTLGNLLSSPFQAAASAILSVFGGVADWFSGFFGWVMSGFEKVAGWARAVKGFFGFGGDDDEAAANSGPPALAPPPQAAAALAGGGFNIDQNTEIIVQGSNDPYATAQAVAGAQSRVNADMARNMQGAAR